MNDVEIMELEQLCRDATWPEYLTVLRYSHGGGRVIQETGPSTSGGPNLIADFYDPGNREFYVAARTALPVLLDELRQLRVENKRLAVDLEQAWATLKDHQLQCHKLVKEWRKQARGLSAYRDTESVVERAALLDCASELDSPLLRAVKDAP